MTSINRAVLVSLVAFLSCQTASAGLFGPSTDLLKGESLTQKLRSQPLVVSVNGGMLDIHTKAAAIGSFILSSLASSALASGGMQPGMNAQQMNNAMQANTQIAQSLSRNMQPVVANMLAAQATKPQVQIAKEGPVAVVSQQLLASLAQTPDLVVSLAGADTRAAPVHLQLRVKQPLWKLDYAMTSSDYTLLHHVQIELYQKESDTIYFTENCQGEFPEKMPLDSWERDDFAAVAKASQKIAEQCALKVVGALGLEQARASAASVAQHTVAAEGTKIADGTQNDLKKTHDMTANVTELPLGATPVLPRPE